MARQVIGPWFRASKQTWYATVGGRSVSLGVRGEANYAEAIRAWHRVMADGPGAMTAPPPQADPPQTDLPKPPGPTADPTVADVVDAFLADAGGRAKPKTLATYRYYLGPFSDKHGHVKAAALNPPMAEAYARKPTWSSSTRNGFLRAVVAVMRWAVRSRLLSGNPLAGIQKPPVTSRGAKALISPAEHRRLLRAASPLFRQVLTVLWATGCRPGEAARVTAADVDWTAGVVTLADHKTAHATGRPRTIYLPPDITGMLRRLAKRHPTGPLLRTRFGWAWTGESIKWAIQDTRRRAGVPHATAYGYRHTWATDALCRGVPDAHVAALMGHSGTATLHRHYSHLSARTAVQRDALRQVR